MMDKHPIVKPAFKNTDDKRGLWSFERQTKSNDVLSNDTSFEEGEDPFSLDNNTRSDESFCYDSSDEEQMFLHENEQRQLMIKMNEKIKYSGSKTKMKFLIKCLNMILLNKGDPFLARKHQQYNLIKRK